VRPILSPGELVRVLSEVGAWGVNLHDNDLVPIDATPADENHIVRDFKSACSRTGFVAHGHRKSLSQAQCFATERSPQRSEVRAYAVQKTMQAMDLGVELGAKIFVLWGGREGTESVCCRRPDEAVKRLRRRSTILRIFLDQDYGYRFALEAKPTNLAATSTCRQPGISCAHHDT